MRLGDVANAQAVPYGKPLDGVRVLAAEQMQALPFATQLLARLGADVVKVEHPEGGESGRGSSPAMLDPYGRAVGATYLRNNLDKRSIGIDLKSSEGRDLFMDLVPKFDVVAENFKAGAMDRMGLGYENVAAKHPGAIYVSISGFGNNGDSPYRDWPAYASIVEAMSGVYDWKSGPDKPPVTIPVGALGDISSALFAVVGVLAALRHRDHTGLGQYVDVAMLDATLAMTDVVTNFWSMGVRPEPDRALEVICEGFRASDGYVVVQIVREAQFERLADLIGHPEWKTDPVFATRAGWGPKLETVIRPAVDRWAAKYTKLEAARELTAAGIVAGPSNRAPDVIADPHFARRDMLVEIPRTDGIDDPVLVPGNPVKMSKVAEGPETMVPWVGEHTSDVLAAELGLDDATINDLRKRRIVT
ncbi:MAG: CoA transferase [Acidimicrobiia bacterium]|nr:CoA transferase [Acidimicrobiia bacterium]